MKIGNFMQFTCWVSLFLLVWMMVTKTIRVDDFATWFAFAFFLISGIIAWALSNPIK
jgi:hypothetical protein